MVNALEATGDELLELNPPKTRTQILAADNVRPFQGWHSVITPKHGRCVS
jgi:hypothetical protein